MWILPVALRTFLSRVSSDRSLKPSIARRSEGNANIYDLRMLYILLNRYLFVFFVHMNNDIAVH